jgi:hypothetical protein
VGGHGHLERAKMAKAIGLRRWHIYAAYLPIAFQKQGHPGKTAKASFGKLIQKKVVSQSKIS